MSTIKILPETLSNKIAAGEVVDRPASVVKELIENAIDAKSTRIITEIENGGRSLIRVSDNGIGMGRDDALLAIERHATSKIHKDDDLFSINTLGFRGEALPSIAAVSQFTLIARDGNSDAGAEVVVDGGTIRGVSETGAPIGTMVSVKRLFFNTPARRKFLKTVQTEMGHIADTVASIALGWPDIHFKLFHNGRPVNSWPAAGSLFDRAVDVLGGDLRTFLHAIEFKDDYLSVSGWTSSPSHTRSTSRKIYIYVNGRHIYDRGLQHALFEGYQGRLMKGSFPVTILYLHLPFDQLDVNVHPAKHEVRFAEQKRVYESVKAAVSDIWKRVDRAKWALAESSFPLELLERKPNIKPDIKPNIKTREQKKRFSGEKTEFPPSPDYNVPKLERADISEHLSVYSPAEQKPFPKDRGAVEKKSSMRNNPQESLWKKRAFADLKLIGQLHDMYIICESQDGVVLIDQHAAHERILFESLKQKKAASQGVSQRLLIPETIELGYGDIVILENILPDLKALGLEIEPFGGNTFAVKAVPAIIADKEAGPLIIEIVEMMQETGLPDGIEKKMDECLMLIACHGAIRANQKLSEKEMKALLSQLDACDNPSNCPHGRPTWFAWTFTELEKKFKRIV